MATEGKESESKFEMSKEDKAFLIKALWRALQAPTWTKDDLITFGKAIFSKMTLGKMPDKTYEAIIPFLSNIADSLGQQLAKEAESPTTTSRPNGTAKKEEEKKVEAAADENDDDDILDEEEKPEAAEASK